MERENLTAGDEVGTGTMEIDDRVRDQENVGNSLTQTSVATAPMFNSGSNVVP
jgi:hypothetical protein